MTCLCCLPPRAQASIKKENEENRARTDAELMPPPPPRKAKAEPRVKKEKAVSRIVYDGTCSACMPVPDPARLCSLLTELHLAVSAQP